MNAYKRIIYIVVTIIIFAGVLLLSRNISHKGCAECNLIIISIDTLRPDHMGIYGYNKNTTPNIDKWAKNATVFTNIRTVIPVTFPSFFALMTGKTPLDAKIYNNFGNFLNGRLMIKNTPIDKKSTTLAEILKINGYTTAAFVTNSALSPELDNINKGFEYFDFLNEDPYAQAEDRKAYTSFIRKAIPWLDKNKDKKFFLWVHLISPHAPYSPPYNFACKMRPDLCGEIVSQNMYELEVERKSLEGCRENEIDQHKLGFFQSFYDGEIAFDDNLIGEIINKIDSLKLNKKSIVVLYGDHGEGFDHNYYFYHSHVLYDSAIQIPFIVKLPNHMNGTNNKLVDNTQILHSLLEMLTIYKSNFWNGNIFDRFTPDMLFNKHYVFSSSADLSKYSIQDSTYKYIYSLPDYACLYNNQSEELYNLVIDPHELKNITQEEPEVTKTLKKALFQYLHKYQLPKALNNINYSSVDKEKQKIIDTLKRIGY